MAGRTDRKRPGSLGPGRVTEDDLLSLVGHIYEAGTDHARWPEVMGETIRVMGNTGSHLFLMDESTGLVSHTVHVDMPDRLMEEYNSDVIRICPRYDNACAHPEWDLLWDYQHIDERDIDRSEYYDWLQDRGETIRYYLGGRLRPSEGPEGFLSLAFRKKEGHATKAHIRLFGKLLPHFNRALELGKRVGTGQLAGSASLEFLNQLSDAVILLGSTGSILVANRAALALTRPGGPFRMGTHSLHLLSRPDDVRLQGLIAGAMATAQGQGTVGGGVMRLSGSPPRMLSVIPLVPGAANGMLALARIALFVRATEVAAAPSPADLQALFGLTLAEARLAAALAGGQTVTEAARAVGISVHTARAQLRQVFGKTGTHRQADLLRLLSGLTRTSPLHLEGT